MYLPLAIDGNDDIGGFMAVIGRLRPGVTAAQAHAELASRQAALSVGKWQWMTVLGQHVTPLPVLVTRDARSPVLLLLAGVGCVLLMACANLANLLLVRASGRRREMQVRAALGASIGRVFGQMTAESAVLVGARRYRRRRARRRDHRDASGARRRFRFARLGEVQVGWPAIAFAAAVCAAVTLVFGSVALLHLRRRDIMDGLRPHAGITTDRRAVYVQRLALATQVAVVVVLTVAGGLLLRSLTTLLDVDPGSTLAARWRSASIRPDASGVQPACRSSIRSSRVSRAVPGVESAALTIHVPMGDRPSMGWDAIPEGASTTRPPTTPRAES